MIGSMQEGGHCLFEAEESREFQSRRSALTGCELLKRGVEEVLQDKGGQVVAKVGVQIRVRRRCSQAAERRPMSR